MTRKTSNYRRTRARQYMDKFEIRYTHALRLVNEEMDRPGFDPQQPLPDELPK